MSFKQASKVAFRRVPGQGDIDNHMASSLTVDGEVSALSNSNGFSELKEGAELNHVKPSSNCAELVSYVEKNHSYY